MTAIRVADGLVRVRLDELPPARMPLEVFGPSSLTTRFETMVAEKWRDDRFVVVTTQVLADGREAALTEGVGAWFANVDDPDSPLLVVPSRRDPDHPIVTSGDIVLARSKTGKLLTARIQEVVTTYGPWTVARAIARRVSDAEQVAFGAAVGTTIQRQAMRSAVQHQSRQWKQREVTEGRLRFGSTLCPNPERRADCLGALTERNVTIDHWAPPFFSIADSFLVMNGLVKSLPLVTVDGAPFLPDGVIKDRWLEFHRRHAVFVTLCGPCNNSKGARRLPDDSLAPITPRGL